MILECSTKIGHQMLDDLHNHIFRECSLMVVHLMLSGSSKEKMRTSTFIINQSEARGMRHFLLKEKPPAGVKEKPPAGVKEKPPQG